MVETGAGATPGQTRGERRDQATADTRTAILAAARGRLLADGYANLSTRAVADAAAVPLSQIHYHFGSKRQLILAVLEAENVRLLERQREMFDTPQPLWVRWERACDFLDADIESGYVRILQEMIAAGWSNPEIAAAVRRFLGGWYELLREISKEAVQRFGTIGSLKPDDIASIIGNAFMGSEALLLLGFEQEGLPIRRALRRFGAVIRSLEERK